MNQTLALRFLSDKFLKSASKATLGMMAASLGALAMASTDVTFNGAVTLLSTWLGGSLGILISLAVFTTGIMITVTKHSLMPVAVAAAAALAINIGPGVLTGMFTATM